MPLSPKSQKYKENKAKMMKFWMVTPVVYVSKGQRAQGCVLNLIFMQFKEKYNCKNLKD